MALRLPQGAARRVIRLTPREREVASYVLQGRANKVIAIDLGISLRTVEAHRAKIFYKLGVRHAVELTHWFYAVAEPDRADVYSQRLRACLGGQPAGEPASSTPSSRPRIESSRDQSQLGGLLPSNSLMGSKSG